MDASLDASPTLPVVAPEPLKPVSANAVLFRVEMLLLDAKSTLRTLRAFPDAARRGEWIAETEAQIAEADKLIELIRTAQYARLYGDLVPGHPSVGVGS